MALFHYFNVIINKGSATGIAGLQVIARAPGGGSVQTIYGDANGTPIAAVSGIANTAVTDANGNISLFIQPGTYDLDYLSPSGVFIARTPSVTMFAGSQGDSAYQVWLNAGNTGSVQDFLNSLVGPTGPLPGQADIITALGVDRDQFLGAFGANGAGSLFFNPGLGETNGVALATILGQMSYSLLHWCASTDPVAQRVELAADMGPAMTRCQTDLVAAGIFGARIQLPLWGMKIGSHVDLKNGTLFVGNGHLESPHVGSSSCRIYRDSPAFQPFSFGFGQDGGGFKEGVAFYEAQPDMSQATFTATDYPAWFAHAGGSSGQEYDELLFYNCSRWFSFGAAGAGGNCGRQVLGRIHGRPLVIGFDYQNCQDTVRLDNLHEWPYGDPATPALDTWCANNAVVINSIRNDDPIFGDIFALGCSVGFRIGQSADGTTTGIQADSLAFDATRVGLQVSASGSINHQIANFHCQPGPNAALPVSRGIEFSAGAANNQFEFGNLVIERTNAESIYDGGGNNTLSIGQALFGTWDDQNTGTMSAINAPASTVIRFGALPTFRSGNARYFTGGCQVDGYHAMGVGVTLTVAADHTVSIPLMMGGTIPRAVFLDLASGGYPFVLSRTGLTASTATYKVYDPIAAAYAAAGSSVVLSYRADS